MSKEEDFFKENFPEYVTEKGEFLSPYWDLFNAGVICATFESKVKIEQLEKENAELKVGRDINVFTKQLTKAKDLIRQLCSMVRELNKPNVQLTNVDYSLAEAEQFISEVEK